MTATDISTGNYGRPQETTRSPLELLADKAAAPPAKADVLDEVQWNRKLATGVLRPGEDPKVMSPSQGAKWAEQQAYIAGTPTEREIEAEAHMLRTERVRRTMVAAEQFLVKRQQIKDVDTQTGLDQLYTRREDQRYHVELQIELRDLEAGIANAKLSEDQRERIELWFKTTQQIADEGKRLLDQEVKTRRELRIREEELYTREALERRARFGAARLTHEEAGVAPTEAGQIISGETTELAASQIEARRHQQNMAIGAAHGQGSQGYQFPQSVIFETIT